MAIGAGLGLAATPEPADCERLDWGRAFQFVEDAAKDGLRRLRQTGCSREILPITNSCRRYQVELLGQCQCAEFGDRLAMTR